MVDALLMCGRFDGAHGMRAVTHDVDPQTLRFVDEGEVRVAWNPVVDLDRVHSSGEVPDERPRLFGRRRAEELGHVAKAVEHRRDHWP